MKDFAGIRGGGDVDEQALFEKRNLVFVELRPDPDDRKIGDVHKMITGHHPAALINTKVLNDTFEGRLEGKHLLRLARPFKLGDLVVTDVPKTEPLFG